VGVQGEGAEGVGGHFGWLLLLGCWLGCKMVVVGFD
jgi:hypothetical protein